MSSKFFNKYMLIFLLFMLQAPLIYSQGDLCVRINETSINEALQTIVDAHGINFGDYIGGFFQLAWFVNLDGATADVHPNNTITLHTNVVLYGQIDIVLFNFSIVEHASVDIDCGIELRNVQNGFQFILNPITATLINYEGDVPNMLINLLDVSNGVSEFVQSMPDIELFTGTELLPNAVTQFFTDPIPTLTTNETDIMICYTVAGDRFVVVETELAGQNNIVDFESEESSNWITRTSPHPYYLPLNSTQNVRAFNGPILHDLKLWRFLNWTRNQVWYSSNRTLSINVTNDETYIAHYPRIAKMNLSTNLEGLGNQGTIIIDGETINSPGEGYSWFYPNTSTLEAPSPQIINGIEYLFVDWSDGNTSRIRTISPQQEETYIANYKAHLYSYSGSTPTSKNSQRKIAVGTDGVHHATYESGGIIYYLKSTDRGNTWSPEVAVSDITIPSSRPSICEYQGDIYIGHV